MPGDASVCSYAGSLEGQDDTASVVLLHQLADDRCSHFKTCGVESGELDGTAKVNHQIFDLLTVGRFPVVSGDCQAVRNAVQRITQLMYIPLIQGVLRYAYRMDMGGG